ncbi:MAG: hypothetical protein KJ064_09755 [Anaerolineae bacterium]|nr:MAG: hypothetical protein F9K27_03930 [Anaerolineae bacterium]MCL4876934.1 hypothetical protein [Anaerolineae bacterium]
MLTRYRIEIKYMLLIVFFLGSLVALDRLDAFEGLDGVVNDFMDWMTKLGFIGMFIVAVIGNSSLLIQVPYTVPLLSAALNGASLPTMLFLGLGAGIGAGFGEVISYGIADRILAQNPDLSKSRLYRWVNRQVLEHPRMIPVIVFIWGATVIPDDTVIIPLAMVKYGIRRIAPPLFISKIIHNFIVSFLFYEATGFWARRISSEVKTDLALGILIVFILVIFYQIEKTKAVADSLRIPEEQGALD